MSKLYSGTFKAGFVMAIAFFAVLNIVAYLFALQQNEKLQNPPIHFAPAARFPAWGFPFKWEGYNLSYEWSEAFSDLCSIADGLALNFLTITTCGFILGFLLRWLMRKYE